MTCVTGTKEALALVLPWEFSGNWRSLETAAGQHCVQVAGLCWPGSRRDWRQASTQEGSSPFSPPLTWCPLLAESNSKQVIKRSVYRPDLHLRASYRILGLELRARCSVSRIRLIVTWLTVARQASLSFSVSRSLLRFMFIELLMLSNHLILFRPLLLLFQSFPASGSLPMSRLLVFGGQSIGASASVSILPLKIQGWFPLRLTGLISLLKAGSF